MGVCILKRFLCVLIACMMIVPVAFSATVDDLSVYSAVLGGSELINGDVRDPYVRFIQDDCTITLKVENSEITLAIVNGSGDKFLSYCAAVLAVFDPDGATLSFGQLLTMYLLSPNGKQEGQTSTGLFFFIEPTEGNLTFTIMK